MMIERRKTINGLKYMHNQNNSPITKKLLFMYTGTMFIVFIILFCMHSMT